MKKRRARLGARVVEVGKLLWATAAKWDSHDALTQSAALAFYTLFSLVPILVVVIAVAGAVFGRDAVRAQIVHQFAGLMGEKPSQAVQEILKSVSSERHGWLAELVGFVTLVIGATAAFVQLQISLNLVWEVAPKPGPLIKTMVRKRLVSFALVVGIGFLLLVSLAISAGLQGFRDYASTRLSVPSALLESGHAVASFAVLALLFAAIFRVLPDAEIAWRDVWLGAVITSCLFSIGKFLIGLYLGQSSLTSPFGAAGSLVLLVLWVYYASLILLFGAEFTRVYTQRVSAVRRPPSPGGERVKKVAVDEVPKGIPLPRR